MPRIAPLKAEIKKALTVEVEENLLRNVKLEAVKNNLSLRRIVEHGLHLFLAEQATTAALLGKKKKARDEE